MELEPIDESKGRKLLEIIRGSDKLGPAYKDVDDNAFLKELDRDPVYQEELHQDMIASGLLSAEIDLDKFRKGLRVKQPPQKSLLDITREQVVTPMAPESEPQTQAQPEPSFFQKTKQAVSDIAGSFNRAVLKTPSAIAKTASEIGTGVVNLLGGEQKVEQDYLYQLADKYDKWLDESPIAKKMIGDPTVNNIYGDIGSGLGQIASMVASGGGGAVQSVAKNPTMWKEIGKKIFNRPTATAFTQVFNSEYENMKRKGESDKTAFDQALANGIAMAPLENLPLANLTERMGKSIGAPIAKRVLNALIQGTEEGAQESLQQIFSNATNNQLAELESSVVDWADGLERSAEAGGIVGLIVGAIAGAKGGRVRPTSPPKELGGIPTVPVPEGTPPFTPEGDENVVDNQYTDMGAEGVQAAPPANQEVPGGPVTYAPVTNEELDAWNQGQRDPERVAAVEEDARAIISDPEYQLPDDPNYQAMVVQRAMEIEDETQAMADTEAETAVDVGGRTPEAGEGVQGMEPQGDGAGIENPPIQANEPVLEDAGSPVVDETQRVVVEEPAAQAKAEQSTVSGKEEGSVGVDVQSTEEQIQEYKQRGFEQNDNGIWVHKDTNPTVKKVLNGWVGKLFAANGGTHAGNIHKEGSGIAGSLGKFNFKTGKMPFLDLVFGKDKTDSDYFVTLSHEMGHDIFERLTPEEKAIIEKNQNLTESAKAHKENRDNKGEIENNASDAEESWSDYVSVYLANKLFDVATDEYNAIPNNILPILESNVKIPKEVLFELGKEQPQPTPQKPAEALPQEPIVKESEGSLTKGEEINTAQDKDSIFEARIGRGKTGDANSGSDRIILKDANLNDNSYRRLQRKVKEGYKDLGNLSDTELKTIINGIYKKVINGFNSGSSIVDIELNDGTKITFTQPNINPNDFKAATQPTSLPASPLTAFNQKGEEGRKARAELKERVGPAKFKQMETIHKDAEKILKGLEGRVVKIVCP